MVKRKRKSWLPWFLPSTILFFLSRLRRSLWIDCFLRSTMPHTKDKLLSSFNLSNSFLFFFSYFVTEKLLFRSQFQVRKIHEHIRIDELSLKKLNLHECRLCKGNNIVFNFVSSLHNTFGSISDLYDLLWHKSNNGSHWNLTIKVEQSVRILNDCSTLSRVLGSFEQNEQSGS